MAVSLLVKKLGIKPGFRVLIMNAPDGYAEQLEPLPPGAEVASKGKGPFDLVYLFAANQAELNRFAPKAVKAVKPLGHLWIAYPKKTSKLNTDLSRDVGWDTVHAAGWTGVAICAVDDTWSALRLRPVEDVGS
jgi:hypothetical protein